MVLIRGRINKQSPNSMNGIVNRAAYIGILSEPSRRVERLRMEKSYCGFNLEYFRALFFLLILSPTISIYAGDR